MTGALMKMPLFLAALLWCTPGAFAQGQAQPQVSSRDRVSVIFISGDLGHLNSTLDEIAKQAQTAHQSQGRRVVVLRGRRDSPPTREDLSRALARLRNVRELHVDFIGHGDLIPTRDQDPRRFPPVLLGPNETLEPRLRPPPDRTFSAVRPNPLVPGQSRLEGLDVRLDGSNNRELLGVGDIQAALDRFDSLNPAAQVQINLLNCHSGAVAEQLRLRPRTRVFASTPPGELASNLQSTDGGVNSLSLYYQRRQASPSEPELESWQKAQSDMRRRLGSRWLVITAGRSPLTHSILGWCRERERRSAMASQTDCLDCSVVQDGASQHVRNLARESLLLSARAELTEIQDRLTEIETAPWFSSMRQEAESCLADENRAEGERLARAPVRETQGTVVLRELFQKLQAEVAPRSPRLTEISLGVAKEARALSRAVPSPMRRQLQSLEALARKNHREIANRLRLRAISLAKHCSEPGRCSRDDRRALASLVRLILPSAPPDSSDRCPPPQKIESWTCLTASGLSPSADAALSVLGDIFDDESLLGRCEAGSEYNSFLRAQRVLSWEQHCVNSFQTQAPESEWQNLRRLQELK